MSLRRPLALALPVLALVLLAPVALAQSAKPTATLKVSDATPRLGQQITVTGSGFATGSDVIVGRVGDRNPLTRARANADGQFSATVTVVRTWKPGPTQLGVTGLSRDRSAVATAFVRVTVLAAGATARSTTRPTPAAQEHADEDDSSQTPQLAAAGILTLLAAALILGTLDRSGDTATAHH